MAEPNPENFENERALFWSNFEASSRKALWVSAEKPPEEVPTMSEATRRFILDNYQRDIDEGRMPEDTVPYILV